MDGEQMAQDRQAGVASLRMAGLTPEESAALKAKIDRRVQDVLAGGDGLPERRTAREEIAERLQACEEDVAAHDERLEAYDARFEAMLAAMAEACRAAGLPPPGEAVVRRHLRLVRDGESA